MNGFRPGLGPALVVLALLPVLIGLGFWQLSRAEEKRALLAAAELRRVASPVDLENLASSADPAWLRVRLEGHFDPRHSLLLDSRIRDGRAGVELLQPFQDASGRWVLVNRGWLPWPDRREPPRFQTPEGPQRLIAWVYVPPGAAFELKPSAASDWPQLVNQVDAAALWQHLARTGLPLELRLEGGPAAYRTDWAVVAMGPEKHLGYAVQWFALATALLGLFIYYGLRKGRENDHEPSTRHA
ncbi:SURF1 family protein [Metapseudomonas furukawaii]|jgi:cytochrome oxidase assembly protein ShyY1|uniref:SURF1-like protein n=1 Tax=Metapseudomonas furukawaii TaxID=1149133 RepID=A0AAD1FDA2_METFU|nr:MULTISPECIES: SURF1 family protein [Pseudomonas]ELS29966.1 Cytochrome oxidase biogenesis protein Surf1, facilitates heme A insertion [Pseudomonas furukawaii]OWJ94667.1 cytochrome oxidase biogenesis protein Surf1,facilitates heme A insertion [Pseudomonas sp. A46]BAU71742.1 cytochrome oxidase biogenesis protein Surf1 [Pseudomonas furukawaii]